MIHISQKSQYHVKCTGIQTLGKIIFLFAKNRSTLSISSIILPPIHFQEYYWLKASAWRPYIFCIRLVGRRGLFHYTVSCGDTPFDHINELKVLFKIVKPRMMILNCDCGHYTFCADQWKYVLKIERLKTLIKKRGRCGMIANETTLV